MRPLEEDEKKIYLEVAQEISDILERFQCTDIHRRNHHYWMVSNFINRMEGGHFQDSAYAARVFTYVQTARDWITKTMREQLIAKEKR